MRQHLSIIAAALVCSTALSPTTRADTRITGTPATYQTPSPVPPPPGPVYGPPPAVPVQVRALTHYEFAKAFHPAPGKYKLELIHPGTCCPVCVEFCLPCGCPKVRVHPRSIVFDYGKEEVVVRFQIGGKVKVSYH